MRVTITAIAIPRLRCANLWRNTRHTYAVDPVLRAEGLGLMVCGLLGLRLLNTTALEFDGSLGS